MEIPETKEVKSIAIINIDDKVSPAMLARLLNRNVSMLYQWSQLGKLPDIRNNSYSYAECIDFLVSSLILAEEAKKLKVTEEIRLREEKAQKRDNARRGKFTGEEGSEYEDSIHPLVAAKMIQSTKTERAREYDLWQKISIKRGEYVAFGDKLELVEGMVISIKDTLAHIANYFPETQEHIDGAMAELYSLGLVLCEEADIDIEEFVQNMIDRPIEQEIVHEDAS